MGLVISDVLAALFGLWPLSVDSKQQVRSELEVGLGRMAEEVNYKRNLSW